MTILNTNDVAERYIFNGLYNDSVLLPLVANRIYLKEGPELSSFPMIIYSQQSAAPDILGLGAKRRLSPLHYMIQAILKDDNDDPLYPIAARIDEIFDGKGNIAVTGGGHILVSYRVRPHSLAQDFVGVSYRYLGGIYRIEVEPN